MAYTTCKIIALASVLSIPSALAAPNKIREQQGPLREQFTALDNAGLVDWEDSHGGRFATVTPSSNSSNVQRDVGDKPFTGFNLNPADWLSSQWTDGISGGVNVLNNVGHYMCPGGGSRMEVSLYDSVALSACKAFVGKSAAGKLGTNAWWAWETAHQLTTTRPESAQAFVRFLLGSVSDTPVKLDQALCEGLWDGVKGLCQEDDGSTQGQAISAGDWTLYIDPNDRNGN
ncbi:hypothetical protein F4818DRAFT_452076 [Hypoxylon cercidicola]|nr:hypothetical protein F4818DRAFT_452076 [Hypoxylon cercidicola]